MKVQNIGTCARRVAIAKNPIQRVTVPPGGTVEIPEELRADFLRRLSDAWRPVEPSAWPPSVSPSPVKALSELPAADAVRKLKGAAAATEEPPRAARG